MSYPDESNLTTLATLKAYLDPQPLGGITSVVVTNGGSGYSTPSISITDPKGTGATATATVVNGVITGITVTAAGQGYTSPSVVITGAGANGAATAKIGSDDALTALINRASNFIVDQLNDVQLAVASATDVRDGNCKTTMILRKRLAQSITSVTIGTTVIPASVNGSAGWVLDQDQNLVQLIGYVFDRGVQNVSIVYSVGIPTGHRWIGQLEQATLVTCALWWKRRAHIDQNSIAAPNGMGTITFSNKDIPPEAWSIINQIKRIAPWV